MMSAAVPTGGERRRYWFSLAALAIVLPTAVLVNSWDSLSEWRSRNNLTPLTVERGATQRYAGAQWRLTSLTRLPKGSTDAILVIAEFEAAVDEPELLRNGPCAAVLTEDRGRRWQPTFLPGRAVRQARPEAVDKPRCGAFPNAEKGKTIMMAATFTVPESATGLALSVTVAGARPEYLLFR
jgi:hypothetical protein